MHRIAEATALVITICVVVALFSIPIIVSRLGSTSTSLVRQQHNSTNSSNCTVSWSRLSVNTSCAPYAGTVCKDVLSAWQLCTVGDQDTVYISELLELTQTQRENDVVQLTSFLVHYEECYKKALPFLCQYQFPLHDCDTLAFTATREDCIAISTGVCAELWSLALAVGYKDKLPDCHSLPTGFNGSALISNYTQMPNESITCREDFIEIDSVCHPRCDLFEQYTHTGTTLMIYSEVITCALGLLVSIFIILLLIKSYKTMFKYPSVFVFFPVFDYILLALLPIIIAVDRNKLFCSSISLLDSLNNPTPFCTFSGAVFYYALVNMCLWWFCHVCTFFHKVVFPFHANRMERMGKNKYILVTVIVLCSIIPLPPVLVSLTIRDYEYTIGRFPPTVCISKSVSMWFYSGLLLIDITVCIGVCMFVIVLWTIRKHKTSEDKRYHLSTAEKKISLVFTSIILFSVFSLADLSNNVARSHQFTTALMSYFTCEAGGYVPGQCDRKEFDGISTPYITVVRYCLLLLIPVTVLNYIVKWRSVRKVVRSRLKRTLKHSVDETGTSVTVAV